MLPAKVRWNVGKITLVVNVASACGLNAAVHGAAEAARGHVLVCGTARASAASWALLSTL
jgi:hypothetical protein